MWKNFNNTWLLIFFILLSNCSYFTTSQDKEVLLQKEIEKWNHFQMSGIIELNYKEFVFRKQFSAQKNETAFRFDIIDSGLFGANPTPFFTLYADSLLYLKKFPEYRLEKIPLPNHFLNLDLKKIVTNKKQVIKNREIKTKDFLLSLDNDMKMNQFVAEDLKIEFYYNHVRQIEKIIVQKEHKNIAVLFIDEITKGNDNIQPLK